MSKKITEKTVGRLHFEFWQKRHSWSIGATLESDDYNTHFALDLYKWSLWIMLSGKE